MNPLNALSDSIARLLAKPASRRRRNTAWRGASAPAVESLETRVLLTLYLNQGDALVPLGASYKCTIDQAQSNYDSDDGFPTVLSPLALPADYHGSFSSGIAFGAMCGYFGGSIDVGDAATQNGAVGAAPPSHVLTSAGGDDVWVRASNPDGSLRWAVRMGGTQQDIGKAVAIDLDGNAFVAGTFRGTADFDPGAGVANLVSNGVEDIFVAKLDKDGNFLWARSAGGTGTANSDDVQDIGLDELGNVYVTGGFSGTVDFDPGAGVTNLATTGVEDHDAFVWKLDKNGSFVWARRVGGENVSRGYRETGQELAIGRNEIYVAGSFVDTVDFDPGAGTADLSTGSDTDSNAFVLKRTRDGTYVWAKSVPANAGFLNPEPTTATGIALDAGGDVLVTGEFWGTADFDPNAGTASRTSAGLGDAYVLKLGAAGDFKWVSVLGGIGFSTGKDVSVDLRGNAYVTGTYDASIDADPGAGVRTLTSVGGNDIFLAKLDPDGRFVQGGSIGGAGGDVVTSINATMGEGFTVTGETFSTTFDYDPTAAVRSFTRLGGSDAFALTFRSVPDVIGRASNGRWYVGRNTSTGFVSSLAGAWNPAAGWTDTQSADFDGDGEPDVASRASNGQWYVGLINDGVLTTALWGYWNPGAGWRDVLAVDFDRDGRADLLGRTSNGQWWLARNTGSAFVQQLVGGWNEAAGWNDVRAADFNRDGRADLVGRTNGGQLWVSLNVAGSLASQYWGYWNPAAGWRDVSAADVNGDGRTDLLGRTSGGEWYVARNVNGTAFANVFWSKWNEGAGWNDVVLGDFNGDGKVDVAGRTDGGEWWVGTNTGSGFAFARWVTWAAGTWADVMAGDFDGDGRTDILGRGSNGRWQLARSGGSAFVNVDYGGWNPDAGWEDVGGDLFFR